MVKKIFYKEYSCNGKKVKIAHNGKLGETLPKKGEKKAKLKHKVFSKKYQLLKVNILNLFFFI